MFGFVGREKPVAVDRRKTWVDKWFKNRAGQVALGAFPNLPLATWLLARGLQWLLNGTPARVAELVAFGALLVWAWMELTCGVNYFRRLLGLVVLAATISSVL